MQNPLQSCAAMLSQLVRTTPRLERPSAAREGAYGEAGWLLSRNTLAATARYRLGDGTGTLESEVATLLEVEQAGRGVLVLADGRALDIVLQRTGTAVAAFTVLGERRQMS
ncbi:hypothetical protein MWN34_07360 [Ancylobacter sp. 6x-1]|uniref:Uncharacterized protein n=1 Tax=Ancylobacter crimeensis TaxID=2579147 RepID=A0ABT0D9W6_9HYPH|nr:hypothetical protein [Ancylobacter crimeensis]MCK0196730.1 hypothetical protein [Ancylobacter crimeensis]